MKDFILNLIARKELAEHFWQGSSAQVVIRPPVPKSLIVSRQGEIVTVTEAHVSMFGWLSSASHDDVEMRFRIDQSGAWIPLSLKRGMENARVAFDSDDGAISSRPIVTKRQGVFAREWARELEIRGMLRGIVDEMPEA
jgi:hypothetical protein